MPWHTPQTWTDGVTEADQTTLGNIETAVDEATMQVGIPLRHFAGANDDAKLDAFMTYASAQTYKGIACLLDENRRYTFQSTHTLYDGFSLKVPYEVCHDQNRSGNPLPNAQFIGTNFLTAPAGTTRGLYLGGLSFDCGSTGRVFAPGGGAIFNCHFHSLSFQNGLNFWGSESPDDNQGTDNISLTGHWNFNNLREPFMHVGGSDNRFAPAQLLLDAGTGTSFMAATEFICHFDALSSTGVAHWYVTCDSHSGFLIEGNTKLLRFWDMDIEGRNPDTPCFGCLVRIENSFVSFRDSRFAFCMTNPSATGRDDGGAIHITGGNVLIDGCSYARATGVAETVPFIHATGGKVRVRNIMALAEDGGPGWTGKPVVHQTVAGIIDADNSVTVTTG